MVSRSTLELDPKLPRTYLKYDFASAISFRASSRSSLSLHNFAKSPRSAEDSQFLQFGQDETFAVLGVAGCQARARKTKLLEFKLRKRLVPTGRVVVQSCAYTGRPSKLRRHSKCSVVFLASESSNSFTTVLLCASLSSAKCVQDL